MARARPAPASRPPDSHRYDAVRVVLLQVLSLNLLVAAVKITYGYTSGAVSILSDGFHSLTDSAANVVALAGIRAARKPPDKEHPYGHRKYETMAAGAIVLFLLLVMVELARSAVTHLGAGHAVRLGDGGFAVMLGTLAVNLLVIRYETRAATRLSSEVLFADATHTRSDVLTSLAVLAALVGIRAGFSVLDPLAALVVAVFIGRAGYGLARETSRILADEIVIAEDDLRAVVMTVPGVVGCHQIRTRGSKDHVFLDLHVWLPGTTPLEQAHRLSHVVKDRLMGRYPQIADVVIHIEPPPATTG